jgi:hypothetical protein
MEEAIHIRRRTHDLQATETEFRRERPFPQPHFGNEEKHGAARLGATRGIGADHRETEFRQQVRSQTEFGNES